MPLELDHFKLGSKLPDVYLIEDYIEASEEERIIREVQSTQAKWVQVHLPRPPSTSWTKAVLY
jgi:hypothetical protein